MPLNRLTANTKCFKGAERYDKHWQEYDGPRWIVWRLLTGCGCQAIICAHGENDALDWWMNAHLHTLFNRPEVQGRMRLKLVNTSQRMHIPERLTGSLHATSLLSLKCARVWHGNKGRVCCRALWFYCIWRHRWRWWVLRGMGALLAARVHSA
jgi:hypothetical protein